jgi:hypothetical protein
MNDLPVLPKLQNLYISSVYWSYRINIQLSCCPQGNIQFTVSIHIKYDTSGVLYITCICHIFHSYKI